MVKQYIEKHALIQDLIGNVQIFPTCVKRAIDNQPVYENLVSEQEVEKLMDERDKYKKYYFRHEYDKWEAEIKQEVASELIIELYDLAKHGKKALVISYEDFDKFRKKHVGETK